nr:TIGR03619 family F420-dependent LLM class oxidoreductase [Nocardia transvalensis]
MVNVPNFGDFADPEVFADLSRSAEEAGWDGLFVWDHIFLWDHVLFDKRQDREFADPWVLLAVAATVTERIRLGTMVTPVARRRPQKLAREVTTLDRLTGGRMVLGVGLGGAAEYSSFGEPADPKIRAARLDEGLEALNLLWSGEQVSYKGSHVVIDDVVFRPTPVQRPRVPIWVGGVWPNKAPMRRAARWDGAVPILPDGPRAEDVRELREFLTRCGADESFDLVVGGTTEPGTAREIIGPVAEAGATWWQERFLDDRLERVEPIRRRILQGPPQL